MAAQAVILVDHGSRRAEANEHLEEIAAALRKERPDWVFWTAHLEVCRPTVGEAVDRAVAAGARRVVVHPFFLLPGRHTREDVPRLVESARERHPAISIQMTDPIGVAPELVSLIVGSIEEVDP